MLILPSQIEAHRSDSELRQLRNKCAVRVGSIRKITTDALSTPTTSYMSAKAVIPVITISLIAGYLIHRFSGGLQ